jgi:The GLUG motif
MSIMNRFQASVTVPLILLAAVSVTNAQYSGGSGEPNGPYQIATAEDLILLGETPDDYDKHFILTADIDLDPNLPGRNVFDRAVIAPDTDSEGHWSQFQGHLFVGVFDGGGHTISHLTIAGGSYLGLFGQLAHGARVSNLGLEAVGIDGADGYAGGLAGINRGNITTSYANGTVNGDDDVGGLVGYNSGGISTSRSASTVRGNDYVGGLVGHNSGSIDTSCSSGTVSGEDDVGGLVGYNGHVITASYSNGRVSGFWSVGGLVGDNRLYVTTSYSSGMVSGFVQVGGLVGEGNSGIIRASMWDIETSGQSSSAGGTGLTTAEMQDMDTFLRVGWDFVDEILNGTCDYWQMSANDYPRSHYLVEADRVTLDGLGTAEEPYLIWDAQDLGAVWFEPLAHYRLEDSLDLSGIMWSMPVVPWFGGTFDGNGYVISNLDIQGSGYLAFFGLLGPQAEISHLALEAIDVGGSGLCVGGLVGYNDKGSIATNFSTGTVNGDEYVGGLVGYNNNDGSIATSDSTAVVSGRRFVGGLLGYNDEGRINASHCTGPVSGVSYVGGLVGYNQKGPIAVSYSTGMVSGSSYVGGLVGYNFFSSISSSYSAGAVTEGALLGGLVGYNEGGNIVKSHSTGSVSGRGDTVGGLVGYNYEGTIATSCSTGAVSGRCTIGGLVGYNSRESYISTSHSVGPVHGDWRDTGGLVGSNDGSVSNCYSTSEITGDSPVGGLVGSNGSAGSIAMSYSTGAVSGRRGWGSDTGGLVGRNGPSGSVAASFWNVETSGQSDSDGGEGKTTAEMQTAEAFLDARWDFENETGNGTDDLWWILEGQDYPRLWWELIEEEPGQ